MSERSEAMKIILLALGAVSFATPAMAQPFDPSEAEECATYSVSNADWRAWDWAEDGLLDNGGRNGWIRWDQIESVPATYLTQEVTAWVRVGAGSTAEVYFRVRDQETDSGSALVGPVGQALGSLDALVEESTWVPVLSWQPEPGDYVTAEVVSGGEARLGELVVCFGASQGEEFERVSEGQRENAESAQAVQAARAGQQTQRGQAAQVAQRGQRAQAAQTAQVAESGQRGQAAQTSQVSQVGQPTQSGQASQTVQVGQPTQSGQAAQVSPSGQAGQTVQVGQPTQSGQAAQVSPSGQAGQTVQVARPEQTAQTGRVAQE
jgi:hypothetical protein